MTNDQARKAEAWHRLKQHLTAGHLTISKAGHNDLFQWKAFGGTLDRPAPPAPMRPLNGLRPTAYFVDEFVAPVFVGVDFAANIGGGSTYDAGAPGPERLLRRF